MFLWPDEAIAADVRQEVQALALGGLRTPSRSTSARASSPWAAGRERRSQTEIAVSLVRALDGVVDVVDELDFEVDDKPITVPADLLFDRAPGVRRRI